MPVLRLASHSESRTRTQLCSLFAAWRALRSGPPKRPPAFVTERVGPLRKALDYDVVICGGTLGIFLAAALQVKGVRTCVVEAGELQGRAQEWNISRSELEDLVECGVMSKEQVEECINIEFNPCRWAAAICLLC